MMLKNANFYLLLFISIAVVSLIAGAYVLGGLGVSLVVAGLVFSFLSFIIARGLSDQLR